MSLQVRPEAIQSMHSSPEAMRPCLFYKLIDASIIRDRKMRIPNKFVKKFGGRLSGFARLVLPNGHDWLVKIRKINHNQWFSDGWNEFVDCNSIRAGYFLLFKYEGYADFCVSIYNLSASEIEYPCVVPRKENPFPDGISIEKQYESQCLEQDKIESSHEDRNLQQTKNVEYSPKTLPSTRDIGVQFDGDLHATSKARTTTKREKQSESTNMVLQVEDLGTKNVCKTIKRSLKAILSKDGKRVTTHAAKKLKSYNPTYQVVLRPSHMGNKGLHLPVSFASMISKTPQFIKIVDCHGKEWQVHCIPSGKHYAKLTKGWLEFLKDNELALGDECEFELIKNNEGMLLKVTTLRNQNR